MALEEAQEVAGRLRPGQVFTMGARDFQRLMEARLVMAGGDSELIFALRTRLAGADE